MRKISTLLVIVLLISSSLLAQKKTKGHFGLKTGVNYSTITSDAANVESDWKTGFVFGAFVKIPLGDKAAIQPEFLYSSMGGSLTYNNIPPTNNYRLNYFALPILLKYDLGKSWAAVLGPQVDFLIQAKTNNDTKISASVNDINFSAAGGVEYWANPAIVLGLRYMYGFTNAWGSSTPKWTNHGAQLTIGFKLN